MAHLHVIALPKATALVYLNVTFAADIILVPPPFSFPHHIQLLQLANTRHFEKLNEKSTAATAERYSKAGSRFRMAPTLRDTKSHRVSMRSVPYKLRGPRRANGAAKKSLHFRLLDLPAELRNNIYEKVAESETAHLSVRTRGNLASASALSRVNRQIRNEFLPIIYICAPKIVARVSNFDFRHIVTFLNRLSEAELQTLPSVTRPNERKMEVELQVLCGAPQRGLLDTTNEGALLMRWLKRANHPSKKGASIDISYVVVDSVAEVDGPWVGKWRTVSGFVRARHPEVHHLLSWAATVERATGTRKVARAESEMAKIESALREGYESYTGIKGSAG